MHSLRRLTRLPTCPGVQPTTQCPRVISTNARHYQCQISTTTTSHQQQQSQATQQYLQNQHNTKQWTVDSPYTGEVIATIPVHTNAQITELVHRADKAQYQWRHTSIDQRVQLLQAFIKQVESKKDDIATSITQQMGKPLSQSTGEVGGLISRTQALIDIAQNTNVLKTEQVDTKSHSTGLHKYITKEPIGVCCVFAPWNYPLLTIINSLATAVLCGNSVLMKHSDRTPLVADMLAQMFADAGAPKGLVQSVHCNYSQTEHLIKHDAIKYVHFTGSVGGGRTVYSTVAKHRFIDVGLELGGKDAAYVTDDVDVKYAAENIVDGSCYNAGQSCCAVERVYVHSSQYQAFIQHAQAAVEQYTLGDPLDDKTTMGPIAQPQQPQVIQQQIDNSVQQGARVLCGGKVATDSNGKGRFYEPTLIVDCTSDMAIMRDETFGPVVAVQRVNDDSEAVKLINDSQYGLTASVWVKDVKRGEKIASHLDVGTVFMNRCDFLDAYLPWSGRRDSGKGIGLSHLGFLPFLRTKGYNFRTKT